MKRLGLIVLTMLVVIMFASVAVAATSTSYSGCSKCGKSSCRTCVKPACNKCAKPSCNTCAKPSPCTSCKQVVVEYRRDVLGNRVPVYTNLAGDALNDQAAGYEGALYSGN